MKKLLFTAAALSCSLMAHASQHYAIPYEHQPRYVNPNTVSEPIIDAATSPWSFEGVSEPDILPIIPETPVAIEYVQKQVDEIVITDYTLQSDILFDFDKYTVNANQMYAVRDVINHIHSTYKRIDNITVTGHTDRLGSDAYNYDLAAKRANTIKTIMVDSGGMPFEYITSISMGENQPVTDGCFDVKNRSLLKQCLQDDRRVQVQVEGLARQSKKTTVPVSTTPNAVIPPSN